MRRARFRCSAAVFCACSSECSVTVSSTCIEVRMRASPQVARYFCVSRALRVRVGVCTRDTHDERDIHHFVRALSYPSL
jgi:hypothetical protein